ncbi:MAG TPA: hypothetical protein VMB18_16980 [Terriglobales bacterium]|nr:hypothetical protein [Terriglobales bacterium]
MEQQSAVSDEPSERLRQFARGDLAAFEVLFREFPCEIYRRTLRIVRDLHFAIGFCFAVVFLLLRLEIFCRFFDHLLGIA